MTPGKGDTKRQILDVALELFAAKGYAGTSVADIAKRLEISKAALYYHFAAKTEILEAVLAASVARYSELVETAADRTPADLLAAVVDATADLYAVGHLIGDDPSVRRALADRTLPLSQEINTALTSRLAGPDPDPAAAARAHAAYAAAKHGALAVMAATGKAPTGADRAELVRAALRALSPA